MRVAVSTKLFSFYTSTISARYTLLSKAICNGFHDIFHRVLFSQKKCSDSTIVETSAHSKINCKIPVVRTIPGDKITSELM